MLRSVHTSQQLYFYPNITRKQAAHHTQACPRHKAAALCSLLFPVNLSLSYLLCFGLRPPSFSKDIRAAYTVFVTGSNEDAQSVSSKDSPVNYTAQSQALD